MNQSKLEVITDAKRGKMHANASRLVLVEFLVVLLIGWKSGANLLSQSCSVERAKPITFRQSITNRPINMPCFWVHYSILRELQTSNPKSWKKLKRPFFALFCYSFLKRKCLLWIVYLLFGLKNPYSYTLTLLIFFFYQGRKGPLGTTKGDWKTWRSWC